MNNSGFQYKVGLFVVVGVALLALLILNFQKGNTLFNPVDKLRVVLPNAAGLKPSADVMMSGVPIGNVTSMDLAEDGKSVNVTISILRKHKIRKDAKFRIDSLGFLGDQYIEVSPPLDTGLSPSNEIAYFQNGDTVEGEVPFNMQDAERSISGVIDQASKTMKDLDQSITNVNASALSTNTLARFVRAVGHLEAVSERAEVVAAGAEDLLSNNAVPFHSTVTNFLVLSARLTNTAAELDELIVSNREDVRAVVTNLTVASDQFKLIALDLQAGKGLAGGLLKDEKMRGEWSSFISNASMMTAQFAAFGSNLNRNGLWHMLWKPKPADKDMPSAHPTKGR